MKVFIIVELNDDYDIDIHYDVKGVFLNKELAIQKAKEIYKNEFKNVKSANEYRIVADYFNCGFEIGDRHYHISVLEREVNENINNE